MRSMYDAAWPPASPPVVDAVAGYIGGDTPHVWTDAEWAAQPARYRLPIFTRSNPGQADAAADAAVTVAWCRAHRQPPGTLTALDYEAAIDGAYLTAYDAAVRAAGWLVVVYGQQSTVLANPEPSGGYWVAHWDGVADDPGWTAKQYTDAGAYDLSEVADSASLWDTHAPTAFSLASREEHMILHKITGSTEIWALSGGLYWHVQDISSEGAYLAAGVPQATITLAEHQAILAAQAAQRVAVTVDTASIAALVPKSYTVTAN